MLALALRPGTAQAGQVIDVIIHVPGHPLENPCNDELVILHGDLHIRQVRTPTPDGGELVKSLITSEGLVGTGATSGLTYTAVDGEASFVHYAPPGRTSVFWDLHWTLLRPQGDAPSSFLVSVIRETVAPDGTVTPTLERSFFVCRSASRAAASGAGPLLALTP